MRKTALFLAIFISCFGYELGELKNIVKTDGVSGNFTQTKSLAGFNKSIKSTGEFRLERVAFTGIRLSLLLQRFL